MFRILEHRIKFFDNRSAEITNCSSDEIYHKWLRGETSAPIIYQGTAQQESIKFQVSGGTIRGLIRTNKTTKFGIPMNSESVGLGDYSPGIYTFEFKKQPIDDIPMARGQWTLVTTFHDTTSREYLRRQINFQIVGPK